MLKGHVLWPSFVLSLRLLCNFRGTVRKDPRPATEPARLDVLMHRAAVRGMAAGGILVALAVSCAAQLPFFAPTDSAAKVVDLVGQVSLVKTTDSYSWALNIGATVQAQQTIVTGADGYA